MTLPLAAPPRRAALGDSDGRSPGAMRGFVDSDTGGVYDPSSLGRILARRCLAGRAARALSAIVSSAIREMMLPMSQPPLESLPGRPIPPDTADVREIAASLDVPPDL